MFGRKKKKTTAKAKDTKKSEAKKSVKQPTAKAAAPKLSTFRENIRKSNEAADKLQAAGFQLQGSPSGVVTVLKLAETRTLKSGYVVKEYKPVWIGNSYVDAANELLHPIKVKDSKKSEAKKTGKQPKEIQGYTAKIKLPDGKVLIASETGLRDIKTLPSRIVLKSKEQALQVATNLATAYGKGAKPVVGTENHKQKNVVTQAKRKK